jgi:hypothetical protein
VGQKKMAVYSKTWFVTGGSKFSGGSKFKTWNGTVGCSCWGSGGGGVAVWKVWRRCDTLGLPERGAVKAGDAWRCGGKTDGACTFVYVFDGASGIAT